MSDKLIDMRDVEFLLYEMLNIEELLSQEEHAELPTTDGVGN